MTTYPLRVFEAPYRGGKARGKPYVTVVLDQLVFFNHDTGFTMRSTFTIELQADISAAEPERRRAFIELVLKVSKQLYTQSSMIASTPPTITVNEVGTSKGKVSHPVFDDKSGE